MSHGKIEKHGYKYGNMPERGQMIRLDESRYRNNPSNNTIDFTKETRNRQLLNRSR